MSYQRNDEASLGLRGGAFSLVIIAVLLAASGDDATAKRRRHHAIKHYNPPYAAIVVDANSGAVMHSSNPDALRHPASLTKIMTLYMLFEQLDAGKVRLDTSLDVSAHAAGQSPTKLGLRTGGTITVEEAIKGMVTRSANDAAVVVAENLGGSEENFATLMTRKAQQLGMSRTTYRNASGLPNDSQVTTARDQAILGRAVQERFPKYYKYFQTRTFTFHGEAIGNHNRLLGRVDGVDGIKTGFTSASGFNLVTSVHRDGRYLVAVVLGGASAGSRDAKMRELVEHHIASASTKRTAPMIAEAAPTAVTPAAIPVRTAAVETPARNTDPRSTQRFALASTNSAPARFEPRSAPARAEPPAIPQVARVAPGSTEPIQPVFVKTVNIRPGTAVRTAAAIPLPFAGLPNPSQPPVAAHAFAARPAAPAVQTRSAPPVRAAPVVTAEGSSPSALAAAAKMPVHSGWMIQVGAYPDETQAKQRLAVVKSKVAAHLLGSADPLTETVQKGSTTFYRARFAGLDKDQAEAACKYLKRNDVDCLTIRN
jgi:D-alanyl-D-alanine carboxypeptidase